MGIANCITRFIRYLLNIFVYRLPYDKVIYCNDTGTFIVDGQIMYKEEFYAKTRSDNIDN